jgi:hypothetical protein
MPCLNITIPLPVAAAPSVIALSERAPLIAERFKTRLCKTFRKTGQCEFLARCMFAHGKEDLRTTEANVADGLVSEIAVKNWQRDAIRATEKALAIVVPLPKPISLPLPTPVAVAAVLSAGTPSPRSISRNSSIVSEAFATTPRPSLSVAVGAPAFVAVATMRAAPSPRRFRHDPYAQFSTWQPLHESASAPSTPRVEAMMLTSPLAFAMRSNSVTPPAVLNRPPTP